MGFVFAICWVMEWAYKIVTLGKKKPYLARRSFKYMSEGCWWSIDKAKMRPGWEPMCGTDEGIRQTAEWFGQNREWSKTCEYQRAL
jgi:sterol-4alpha-carboxylate 3-dehydrogenase (decarboxylating)